MQVALLAYVGAAGLAGVTVVSVLMLTPAGQVVQQAIEPARELVQSILPSSLPSMWAFDPGQERIGPGVAAAVLIATPVVVDAAAAPVADQTAQRGADDPALVAPSVGSSAGASIRPAQISSQPSTLAPQTDAGEAAPADELIGEALAAVQPAQPGSSSPASALPDAPPLAVQAATAEPSVVARATARPLPVELAIAPTNAQQTVAAVVAVSTALPVRSVPNRTRTDAPAATPEPTRVPVAVVIEPTRGVPTAVPVAPTPVPVAPTPVPVVAPTVAPTAVPAPTQRSVVAPTHVPTPPPATQVPAPTATPAPDNTPVPAPSQRPTQTSVPARAATQTSVPTRAATQTSVPTRAATQTPVPSPTSKPTVKPTVMPTVKPTVKPTTVPTHVPATATPAHENRPVPRPTLEPEHG